MHDGVWWILLIRAIGEAHTIGNGQWIVWTSVDRHTTRMQRDETADWACLTSRLEGIVVAPPHDPAGGVEPKAGSRYHIVRPSQKSRYRMVREKLLGGSAIARDCLLKHLNRERCNAAANGLCKSLDRRAPHRRVWCDWNARGQLVNGLKPSDYRVDIERTRGLLLAGYREAEETH